MINIENEIKGLKNDIKWMREDTKEILRLVKKVVNGDVTTKDEFITSKVFKEREHLTQRAMYYILENFPHLKSKKKGIGMLINYTEYLRIKRK